MIEERAVVIALEGEVALLAAQRQSACGHCAVKSGCGTSVLAGVLGRKVSHIRVENTLHARPGDEVLLGLAEHALVAGSLLVYVLPLLALLLGALLGEGLAVQLGLDAGLMPVLGGSAGFALAFLLVRRILKNGATGQSMQPVMLKILGSSSTQAGVLTDCVPQQKSG